MEGKILRNDKESLELELDTLTVAELLRNELWQDDAVEAAAWRREHPTKNPVLLVKTKGKTAKKALSDCIERLEKANDNVKIACAKSKKKCRIIDVVKCGQYSPGFYRICVDFEVR